MSQHAKVHSVALLKLLRASLATFSHTAAVALDEVATDIQRTLAWLNEDRRRHWTEQVRVCRERALQAKLALKQKQVLDRALSGTTSSAVEERKALALAERRLREAEAKLARTRSWILQIEKLQSDYRGGIQGLLSAIDADIPNARARLDKMIDSLEDYIALAPPETPADVEKTAPESVFRPEPEPSLQNTPEKLRGNVPEPEVWAEAPTVSKPPEWTADIAPPDMGTDSDGQRNDGRAPAPDDKVLVACVEGVPDVVFLVRSAGGDGSSGWFIGGETKTEGYVVVHVADLVHAAPQLQRVLSLPAGSLVLIDRRQATATVFDADNNVLSQIPVPTGPQR
jgi:hypothetical protein